QWPRVSIGPYLVLAVLAAAVFVPLIFLVIGSFSTARIPTNTNWSTISLANYAAIWLDPQTYRLLLNAVIPMTLAVPGLLQAMSWVLLLSPKSGFVNRALMAWWGLSAAPINIYTLSGMAFVEGLHLVPTAFLMLVPLLRTMDPALEEAAAMAGASPVSIVRRVTLKLMLPGIVA